MRYFTVDGMLSGTGIRDSVEGGYLVPSELGLSAGLAGRISRWLNSYEEAHFAQYEDRQQVLELDAEGMEICRKLKEEFPESKIEYFSAAEMRKHLLPK